MKFYMFTGFLKEFIIINNKAMLIYKKSKLVRKTARVMFEKIQDPFEKMVWPKDVKGAGQLAAVDEEQEQLPDDTIITL